MDQLLASGLGALPSREKWEYYSLVLGSPKPGSVPVGLSSKAYRALMRGDPSGDHVAPEPPHGDRGESDSASSSIVIVTEAAARRSVRSRRPRRGSREPIEDIVFPMGRPTEAKAAAPKKGKASAEPPEVSRAGPSSSGQWKPPSTEWGDQFVVDGLVFKVDVWPLSPPLMVGGNTHGAT